MHACITARGQWYIKDAIVTLYIYIFVLVSLNVSKSIASSNHMIGDSAFNVLDIQW